MQTQYTIYKTTNQIDGKYYVGCHMTNDIHDDYIGSGLHLKRAIKKHGAENFEKEILHVFDNKEDAYIKEAEIVNEDFLVQENTYNLKTGGVGGSKHSEESKLKMSLAQQGKNHSEETKKKMSILKQGKNHNMYGKKLSEEHKVKLSLANKGKKHSEKSKLKMSLAKRRSVLAK